MSIFQSKEDFPFSSLISFIIENISYKYKMIKKITKCKIIFTFSINIYISFYICKLKKKYKKTTNTFTLTSN